MAFVRIQSVSKTFSTRDKVVALREFSLTLEAGEMIGILGPSGCGKSTLLRCVAGLEKPDSGMIEIAGTVVCNNQRWVMPEKRGIGMVFQSYALWPHMTVFENVAFPLKMARRPRAEVRERVGQALGVVGLSGKESRFPSQLSGGQQQRVALARAIIANPKLLLFDEPLSNLDAKLREAMRLELREIHKRMGWTALYVTHDRTEAMTMADRVVVLNDGAIQQVGRPVELYNHPVNIFVAEFLGDMNYFPAAPGSDGKLLPDLGPSAAANLAITGSGFRIGFRPEALRLAPLTGGEAPTGAWLGQIRSATNIGGYIDYVVEVNGVALKIRSPVDVALPANAMASVWPDLEQALRFEGTQRIEQKHSQS